MMSSASLGSFSAPALPFSRFSVGIVQTPSGLMSDQRKVRTFSQTLRGQQQQLGQGTEGAGLVSGVPYPAQLIIGQDTAALAILLGDTPPDADEWRGIVIGAVAAAKCQSCARPMRPRQLVPARGDPRYDRAAWRRRCA